jgi:RHS repeat-associated protein
LVGGTTYADFDGNGNLTNRYLYGPAIDQLFGKMDSCGNTRWYLTDRLGSVRQVANPTGGVLDTVNYDSFGNILSESSPTNGDRFKFTAREFDTLIGIQFSRARYYDSASGRWLTTDPIRFAGGDSNLYRYVANEPTENTDPAGADKKKGGGKSYSDGGMGYTGGGKSYSDGGMGYTDGGKSHSDGGMGYTDGGKSHSSAAGPPEFGGGAGGYGAGAVTGGVTAATGVASGMMLVVVVTGWTPPGLFFWTIVGLGAIAGGAYGGARGYRDGREATTAREGAILALQDPRLYYWSFVLGLGIGFRFGLW